MELTSIYDTAPIGLAVLDTDLRFLRVNRRLAEINGLSPEEHLGRTVAELLPDLGPQAEHVLRTILATGQPLRDVEVRGQTPARPGVDRVWIEQFTPLKDDAGRVVAISIVAEEVTESRRLQRELHVGERRLSLALQAARLVMWEWNLRTDQLSFPLGDWLEYPVEGTPHTMRDFRELVHPQDVELVEGSLRAHLSGHQPVYECEFRVRCADGGYRWTLSRGQVTSRDEQGRPLLMTGFRQDVTARRLAEADRREQAQLLELASDAIFVWNVGDGIERWNSGAERQYGFSREEALGSVSHELLQTEFPAPLPEILEHVESRGMWRGQLVHHTKSGDRLHVEALLQRVNGQSGRILEIARDVTAERAARERVADSERRLRVSQQRLDIALQAGRMGVWEWVPGTGAVHWSPQMYELTGISPATGPSSLTALMELVHPDDRPVGDAQLARVLDRGGDYDVEYRIRTPQGRERTLLSRGRVLHSGERASRLIGISMDITAQKAMEESLREEDARRNEFLAMLGHELRNPLAPIMNAVRLLEKTGDHPDKRAAAIQIMKRQSQQMARLVDDLLEVSRITQGRVELRMENLLVATAAYSALEAARPLAREKQQRIDIDIPPDLDVVADPARLTQILSNLVVNAVKYTPPGGHIEVRAHAVQEGDVVIRVSDDGMGISPELLPRIFELFTQDRRTLDRSEGGLGLGLALVKRLVELQGGSVQGDSAGIGRGATFTVRLPRHGRRQELRPTEAHENSVRLAPMSILIVDDNKDAAKTTALLLGLDGHRVAL
ncbi:MAG TPA: PAS domain-containing protein, partial [Ramlibacter sp.]